MQIASSYWYLRTVRIHTLSLHIWGQRWTYFTWEIIYFVTVRAYEVAVDLDLFAPQELRDFRAHKGPNISAINVKFQSCSCSGSYRAKGIFPRMEIELKPSDRLFEPYKLHPGNWESNPECRHPFSLSIQDNTSCPERELCKFTLYLHSRWHVPSISAFRFDQISYSE